MAAVGDAMLIDSGPTGLHLHVIIWGPGDVEWLASKPQMILAGVTTIYTGVPHDTGCVLAAGEHEFISHDSYVHFRKLRVDEPAHIDAMVNAGQWKAKTGCSGALVKKMRAGLCASRMVDRRFKLLLDCPA